MLPASQGSGCSALQASQTHLDPVRKLVIVLVKRPGDYEPMGCLYIYVLVCLFVCVYVCFCMSLTSYACLYVSLYVYMCLLFVSMCLCVCLYHCGWCICLCDYVSENQFVCACLCPCTVVGASLGLTLRGRGLPVHVYTPVTHLGQWHPVEFSLVLVVIHPIKHHHTAFRSACVERREEEIFGGQ